MAVTQTVELPVVAAGICGTDAQRYRAGFPMRSLGHEVVVESADGDLHAVRPLRPCATCLWCRRGASEQCTGDRGMGRDPAAAGGFSGRVQVTEGQLYSLPANVPARLAVLADPLACVLHALRSLVLPGRSALVVGDGPMAALSAIVLRQRGATDTIIAMKSRARVGRLIPFALTAVPENKVASDTYDVVVECVGGDDTGPLRTAVSAVAPLGDIVCLGVYPPRLTSGLPIRVLLEKEATLQGSKAYRATDSDDDFREALALLSQKLTSFAGVVTTILPLADEERMTAELIRRSGLKTVGIADGTTSTETGERQQGCSAGRNE